MIISIRGTVTDISGRPLQNIKILAHHEPTGSQFAQFTDQDGVYQFVDIKAGGPYALTAMGEGFPPIAEKGVKLNIGQVYEHNFNLTPEE